jgi:hypothetical protein
MPKDRQEKFHTTVFDVGRMLNSFYVVSQKNPGGSRNHIQHRFQPCKVKPSDLETKLHIVFPMRKKFPRFIGVDP